MLQKKIVREVNALVIRCPQKELGCEWEGELGQLQRHLNPGAGVSSAQGCEFLTVECAYHCGAQLQRRLIQEHEMEACPKRPIEMQVASLMKKFEAVVTENQILKQELNETKKIHQQSLNEVKKELGDLKQAHNQQRKELREAKEENKRANRKIGALEKKYASLQTSTMKQELGDLKRALHRQREDLQMHAIPLPVPPFYFSLSNFKHYQSNELTFYSEPFYSHPGGYKMRVQIHPNGKGDARGAYVSLYVAIVRGEFDDQLHWPFDGSVTVEAYNRTTEQWSNGHVVIMNKERCTKQIERCVDILTQGGRGCSTFLSFSDLNDNYLKGTAIVRFRVTNIKVMSA